MYANMVTRSVYKKKEVSIPRNKMKHISPLQRHVFHIESLKRIHIFSQFLPLLVMIDKGYKKLENASPEKHKDDQGGTKNP